MAFWFFVLAHRLNYESKREISRTFRLSNLKIEDLELIN